MDHLIIAEAELRRIVQEKDAIITKLSGEIARLKKLLARHDSKPVSAGKVSQFQKVGQTANR